MIKIFRMLVYYFTNYLAFIGVDSTGWAIADLAPRESGFDIVGLGGGGLRVDWAGSAEDARFDFGNVSVSCSVAIRFTLFFWPHQGHDIISPDSIGNRILNGLVHFVQIYISNSGFSSVFATSGPLGCSGSER